MDRPPTSRPRGICKYYQKPQGCFAGATCKFLHGDPDTTSLTPYDASKTCHYYARGFCKRGDQCWFRHVDPASNAITQEDETCCICFEKPAIYGLLGCCSHVFCLQCIRQWRDHKGKSTDVVDSGNTKKCPMCRERTKFITPSSKFYRTGDPQKDLVIQQYRESMARVPCKYFEDSKDSHPFCPFGKDCFYQHLNADGTPYTFKDGVDRCMKIYHRRRTRHFLDLPPIHFDFDFGLGGDNEMGQEAGEQLAHQLEIATRALRRVQEAHVIDYDADQDTGEESMGPHADDYIDSTALQGIQRALGSIRETIGRLATRFRDGVYQWSADPIDDWDFAWQTNLPADEPQEEPEGRLSTDLNALDISSLQIPATAVDLSSRTASPRIESQPIPTTGSLLESNNQSGEAGPGPEHEASAIPAFPNAGGAVATLPGISSPAEGSNISGGPIPESFVTDWPCRCEASSSLEEPRFMTDGRGRVTWSATCEAPRGVNSIEQSKPQEPEFTTDGRGRVIAVGIRQTSDGLGEEAGGTSADQQPPSVP